MQIEQKQNRIFRPQSNTTLSAEESNQVTTELENVIRAGNLTPNAGTLTQVRDAIQNVVDTAANDLQEQIDAITSASDVFDVVGTYAQLQAYDTSTVPVNDIIKVLQDETRDNAMTYYRWNGTAWVFIGAEGPYYTVSETDTKFATKAQLPGIATTQQAGLVKPDGQTTIVQQDGTLTVSSNVAAALPLLTPIWSDHLLNNASYLRGDTFSWQSGSVYASVYQHLVDDIAGKTSETETIAGTTVTFYRADDEHKIVLADQETNVQSIYISTGVAWYFILDAANQRFKLPRINPAKEELSISSTVPVITTEQTPGADAYGKFISSSNATNATVGANPASGQQVTNTNGLYKVNVTNSMGYYDPNGTLLADLSTQTTVFGGKKYLYFYAGNTIQNETTIDVAEITEALNNKVDASQLAEVQCVVEVNDYGVSYCYVRSDGWCEQGGTYYQGSSISGDNTINFLKQFVNTNYNFIAFPVHSTANVQAYTLYEKYPSRTTSSTVLRCASALFGYSWVAKGYIK